MTTPRIDRRFLIGKILLTGVLVAPILGAAPYVAMVMSDVGSASVGAVASSVFWVLWSAVSMTAPFGLLCATLLAWRCFRWAAGGVQEMEILVRCLVLGAVLGALWGSFVSTTQGGWVTEVGELLERMLNPIWWPSGAVAGALAGGLLFRLFQKELGSVQTTRTRVGETRQVRDGPD